MAIFAKYDGIDGESQDSKHDKWINVLAVFWGAEHPGGGATGASRRRGAATVEDLTLSIKYEKAAPKLLEKCLTGAVIPKLEIDLTATYGGARATYLQYELKNVMITSFYTDAAADDEAGPPSVHLTNDFEDIKVTYTEYDDSGTSRGTVETSYKAN